MTPKKLLYNPTLETLLMVEDFIHKHSPSGEFTKYQIWKRLPRKMMYQTYCVVFDYLIHSGRIAVDSVGKVGYIWNPELVRKYLHREDLEWKPEEHEKELKRWKTEERKSKKIRKKNETIQLFGFFWDDFTSTSRTAWCIQTPWSW